MKKKLKNGDVRNNFQISFQSYGVKIGVCADSSEIISALKDDLNIINPSGFEIIDDSQIEHLIEIKPERNDGIEVFKDGELLTVWEPQRSILPYLHSQLRLTVAEYAESKLFLHAGAVGWKGRAILLPAKSFFGKSTLIAELVKKGALYYSDDFAVLDQDGLLHPFHRQISLRGYEDKYKQVDFSVESLGGKASNEPIPIGIVLITRYKEGKKNPENWKPQILSGGRGIMEILPHTIPIRNNPKFSLEVLNKVSKRAIICKSQRGDASDFASLLLNFFESNVIK
jgi:hypothetical protein